MAYPVTCPSCGKAFQLATNVYERKVAGKIVSIKCKQCQTGIRVDATEVGTLKVVGMTPPGGGEMSVGPKPPEAPQPKAAPAAPAAAAQAGSPAAAAPAAGTPMRMRQPTLIGMVSPKSAAQTPAVTAPKPAPPPLLWAVDSGGIGDDRELSDEEIRLEIHAGTISPQTLVWRDGMDEWLEIEKVPDLQKFLAPASPAPALASSQLLPPRQRLASSQRLPRATRAEGAEYGLRRGGRRRADDDLRPLGSERVVRAVPGGSAREGDDGARDAGRDGEARGKFARPGDDDAHDAFAGGEARRNAARPAASRSGPPRRFRKVATGRERGDGHRSPTRRLRRLQRRRGLRSRMRHGHRWARRDLHAPRPPLARMRRGHRWANAPRPPLANAPRPPLANAPLHRSRTHRLRRFRPLPDPSVSERRRRSATLPRRLRPSAPFQTRRSARPRTRHSAAEAAPPLQPAPPARSRTRVFSGGYAGS